MYFYLPLITWKSNKMTETDATKRPLKMPEKFIPYLDKYRIYRMFKDMLEDLLLTLPKDHLKRMKIFLGYHLHHTNDIDRVMLLISPELKLDIKKFVKDLIKNLGYFVITRRCIMDKYEEHDDYKPGCIDPMLLSLVTRNMTQREAVETAGWLMFDHPCTLREARCLQQDGVLPTVTIVVSKTPSTAPVAENNATPARGFFDQDFVGLKYAYKATAKEVYMDEGENLDSLVIKVFNAIRAAAAGAQGPGQGFSVVGAPSTYRVLLIGPHGSGRRTHAALLAQHFNLVFLDVDYLLRQAKERKDDIGKRLKSYGPSIELKAEVIRRRLLEQDCVDQGWVMIQYPTTGVEFDQLEKMDTPPNRIIFLNPDRSECKERLLKRGRDASVLEKCMPRAGSKVLEEHGTLFTEEEIDNELDNYFMEHLAELRAAAGMTAVEIKTKSKSIEEVQVKIQAAVIQAPAFDILMGAPVRKDVRID